MNAAMPTLLDHYDVADMLQIPARRVLHMVQDGVIPCIELPGQGGQPLFDINELRAGVESWKRPAKAVADA
jgi:hypothetical protein